MNCINVLGTSYIIEKKEYKDDPIFEKKGIDGYCDGYLKRIVHCDMRTYPNYEEESEEYLKICEKQTLRHEIIHAFFIESGLDECSACFNGPWPRNEEMIDWLAYQAPKIFKVFKELELL